MPNALLPRRSVERFAAGVCFFLAAATVLPAQSPPAALASPCLRARIAVVAVPPGSAQSNGTLSIAVSSDAWKALLLNEGVTIDPVEWATALDLTKSTLAGSDAFRVVEAPAAPANPENEPAMLLLARYGAGVNGQRVFMRLVDAKTGTLLTSADASAASMKEAIGTALQRIETAANLLPWRCHVVGVAEDLMVMDRGRLDGVREGQQFMGYSIDKAGANTAGLSDEQRMMQFGKKTGSYKVVEEGQNFSKVQGVNNAPILKSGDVLELPEIRLKDRARESRGKRVWDKLYEKSE